MPTPYNYAIAASLLKPASGHIRHAADSINNSTILPTSAQTPSAVTPFGAQKDLPIHGRAQGGEEGNIVIEENPIDWTYRPADLQGIHGAFAVFVTGNSMVPKYKNHDLAYIHPAQTPHRGRHVLVETINHGGFIKKFECWDKDTLIVSQYNPEKTLRFERHEIRNLMLVIGSLDA